MWRSTVTYPSHSLHHFTWRRRLQVQISFEPIQILIFHSDFRRDPTSSQQSKMGPEAWNWQLYWGFRARCISVGRWVKQPCPWSSQVNLLIYSTCSENQGSSADKIGCWLCSILCNYSSSGIRLYVSCDYNKSYQTPALSVTAALKLCIIIEN
jgi:hypothetical protein